MIDINKEKQMISETKKMKKKVKWPLKYKTNANRALKASNSIMVMYLNRKGEIEQPMLVPIYNGNLIIVRNHVHQLDPRSLWTAKFGNKHYRVLIQKQIDRKAVSNLDIEEIRKNGDATDSDELLITAALKAQMGASKKPINKGMVMGVGILIILGILGFVAYSFLSGGPV